MSDFAAERDRLITDLRSVLNAAATAHERARFVAGELELAVYALGANGHAQVAGDKLSGLMYVRLLTETAIRLRWIGGDRERADAAGRFVIDADIARSRVDARRKRDLLLLARAQKAMHDGDRTLAEKLEALANEIPGMAGPSDVRAMADSTTGASSQAAYDGFRMCSAVIHPGAAIGRADLLPAERIADMAISSAALCLVWGAAILSALGVELPAAQRHLASAADG